MTGGPAPASGEDRQQRCGGPLLLGVRHHGPGSAHAVRRALDAYEPRVLLVEGPPEADALVPLAAEDGMRPPVALLAHVRDEPGRAAFWPLAAFSPEWVAMRWALARGVPVRFVDLPAAHSLAMAGREGREVREERPAGERDSPGGSGTGAPEGRGSGGADEEKEKAEQPEKAEGSPGPTVGGVAEALRRDPLAVLAEAAGHDDAERWWEDVVEHRAGARGDPYAPFRVLGEAMGALREAHGDDGGGRRDPVREAHMRLRLREAVREFGEEGTAVVCGAWHVPALAAKTTATADRRLLKGLPKVRADLTWVPWTHRRLSRRSGYGAGIDSPGWYGHLFDAPDRPVARWMTKVAGMLREEDHGVSSAHVIEAVRLADSLAAMRGRPLAGLTETTDAVRAVLCEGSDVPLALVRERLVVGDVLGEVPDGTPAVPLQRDLERTRRALRLKPEAREREWDLDLRKETDAARSRLLHRLRLLGVGWGTPRTRTGHTGTFRESWRLCWEPESAVRVAEAGIWGTTVYGAATAKAVADASGAESLAEVSALAEQCLLARLPQALPVVMRRLADRAALDRDVGRLAEALPSLVRSVRYGNVRGTDSAALAEVAEGLAERICVGLPPACADLDAEGAAQMRDRIDSVQRSVALLAQARPGSETEAGAGLGADRGQAAEAGTRSGPEGASPAVNAEALRGRWRRVLRTLADRDRVPGLLRGRSARLLLDDGQWTVGDAARAMSLALSSGTPPAEAAAWIEGFLAGGGLLLVHDERLLALVDGWLAGVADEAFTHVLPLLRRTFAGFEPGERRTIGELVRRGPVGGPAGPEHGGPEAAGGGGPAAPGFGPGLDGARADAVLPALRLLLAGAGAHRTAKAESGAERGTAAAGPERGEHVDAVEGAAR